MNDLNNCTFIGRITKVVELQYTNNGIPFSKFSIAVNKKKKDKESVSFFNMVIWGKTAENLTQYLSKGKLVSIICEACQSRWENDEGAQSRIEFNVQSIQLLGGESKNESVQRKPYQPVKHVEKYVGPEEFVDDIPF